MKIAITYRPHEAPQAAGIISMIRKYLPGIKARKSDRYAPFYHVYLTTRNPENPRKYKGNP